MQHLIRLGLCVFLCACVTGPRVLAPEERQALAEQARIDAIHYAGAGLSLMTPGKAATGGLFGAAGAVGALAVADAEGAQMMSTYTLADPAARVAGQLAARLSSDLGLGNVHVEDVPARSDDLASLRERYGSGALLDVATTRWRILYYPMDWSHYRIAYSARVRLVRLAEQRVAWEGSCEFVGEDLSTSPTLAELRANDAEILKHKLTEAADACAAQLGTALAGRQP